MHGHGVLPAEAAQLDLTTKAVVLFGGVPASLAVMGIMPVLTPSNRSIYKTSARH